MGRPAKNPEHPLTRLRKALSTPNQQMTRALFSKKVGIPATTIKAIETGKFKISDKNVAQIASATKVDPKCLMDPSLPVTDYLGVLLEGPGKPFAAYFGEEFVDIRALLDTAFQVAEEKKKEAVFSFLFQRWLEETSDILSLGRAITDKLQERYPIQCFGAIPENFWPKNREKRKEIDKLVKRFEKRLAAEIGKVLYPLERPTLEEMTREETAKLNPEEANTDPEAFLERWQKAQELALERWFMVQKQRDRERDRRSFERHADVAWDLRKKMIEEAKVSLQKQAKR